LKQGKAPSVYGKFCQEKDDPKKCGVIPSDDKFVSTYTSYTKAMQIGQILTITFNHNENRCKNEYEG